MHFFLHETDSHVKKIGFFLHEARHMMPDIVSMFCMRMRTKNATIAWRAGREGGMLRRRGLNAVAAGCQGGQTQQGKRYRGRLGYQSR